MDVSALLKRRATREWREPVTHTALTERRNFGEVVQTYSEEEAKREASRCLDCHTYCSLCVGVCPNLALMTYTATPVDVSLPILAPRDGKMQRVDSESFRVDQGPQIAVLTDFCNECGDCVTFCPTAGEPYKDKPRLYLDRTDFEAQTDNAFMIFRDGNTWSMDARWAGTTHRIEWGNALTYRSDAIEATLDAATLEVREATARNGHDRVSLEPCAAMFVLLQGIRNSMPYLPAGRTTGEAESGRICHPGYDP